MTWKSVALTSLIVFTGVGAVWAQLNTWQQRGPEGGWVSSISASPINDEVVVVVTGGGVLHSYNGGAQWTEVLTALEVPCGGGGSDVSGEEIFYVATCAGVFRSDDRGATWQRLIADSTGTVVVDPIDPDTVYAGGFGGRVFRTVDGGVSWEEVFIEGVSRTVSDLWADPAQSARIYAAAGAAGVWRSDNRGEDWTHVSVGLEGERVFDLEMVGGRLLAAAVRVYASSDGGGHWERLDGVFGNSIALDPANSEAAYTTDGNLIFRSTDGGELWNSVRAPDHAAALTVTPTRVYLGGVGRGFFVSRDDGSSWTPMNSNLDVTPIFSIAGHFQQPDIVIAAAPAATVGLFRSVDGGDNWSEVFSDSWNSVAAVSSGSETRFYAGGNRRLAFSDDGGESWTIGGFDRGSVTAIAAASSDEVYVATSDSVWKGDGVSAEWQELTGGLPDAIFNRLAVQPGSEPTIYLGTTAQGVFKRIGGSDWQPVNRGLQNLQVQDLYVEPRQGGRIYAAVSLGIYRSDDGGASWRMIRRGFSRAVAGDPKDFNTVYATAGGFQVSRDGGETWRNFATGLGHAVRSIHVFRSRSRVLAGGTSSTFSLDLVDGATRFAQFGEGRGLLSSRLLLLNPNDSQARAHILTKNQDGAAMQIDLNGVVGSEFNVAIPPQGVALLETDGLGDLRAGSLSVFSDHVIGGVVLFGGSTGLAGVGASPAATGSLEFPVETALPDGMRTGFALVGLDSLAQTADLQLRDAEGTPVATTLIDLPPLGQVARFIDELPWSPRPDFNRFEGVLEITSESLVAATALRSEAGELATFPVSSLQPTPVPAGSAARPERLLFAQFGEGRGLLASQLLLLNPEATRDVEGTLFLRGQDGDPLTVDLNGQVFTGQVPIRVPGGGVSRFATDGQGPLVAGFVEVESDSTLAGTILFGGAVGVAGVGAGQVTGSGFWAIVESNENGGSNSGIAVANTEDASAHLQLELYDGSGIRAASGELTLPPRGHLAQFLDEIDWDVPVDFADFTGSIRVLTDRAVGATVILTRPGQLATLPVFTLEELGFAQE